MRMNIVRYVTLSLLLASLAACRQSSGQNTSNSPVKLETEEQKTLYTLGLLVGGNIKPFALTPDELAIVNAGMSDAVSGAKPQVGLAAYGPKVNELAQKRAAAGAEETKKKGQEFADAVAQQPGATKTP